LKSNIGSWATGLAFSFLTRYSKPVKTIAEKLKSIENETTLVWSNLQKSHGFTQGDGGQRTRDGIWRLADSV